MKKRFHSLFLAVLLLLSFCISVRAADPDSPRVVDNAGLLTPEELADLSRQVYDQRYKLELDIAIVTTWDLDGMDVQEYADDFYDRNNYGYGENQSGILLLLSMETREWYISTAGEAIYIFTDYGLDQLGNDIVPYLSNGDYYEAFSRWVSALEFYVQNYRQGAVVDGYVQPDAYGTGKEQIVYSDSLSPGTRFLISLAVGLIAALITILIMRSSMNTAKLQSGAVDYLKNGSFHMTLRQDMFLYSHVTRTPKPKDNGGGSSVHRSSGGTSHGGRGGKF